MPKEGILRKWGQLSSGPLTSQDSYAVRLSRELGYCETRSNYCFSLFLIAIPKTESFLHKSNLESCVVLGWPSKKMKDKGLP